MNTQSDLKGITCAVDHCSHTVDPLDLGTREQLHDGRANPYPAGDCHCHDPRQLHFGAQITVIGENQEPESSWIEINKLIERSL